MKVLLINIDSKNPNLALHKIAVYYQNKGDEVYWDLPLLAGKSDKIYVSCIFSWNKTQCDEWEGRAEIGGSGYSLTKKLPEEIEKICPRINLGFTTRGCIRKCSWCIVPQKEGKIRVVRELIDLWDGKTKDVVVLDNNILAMPEHFFKICRQAQENSIRIDFNQGLDHRLLSEKILKTLKATSHKEYKFAFDTVSVQPSVEKAIELLQSNGINRCTWYVLVGFNTSYTEDLNRLEFLKKRNQNAYVQRYNNIKRAEYIPLAQWANQHHIFQSMTFEQFLERRTENKDAVEMALAKQ